MLCSGRTAGLIPTCRPMYFLLFFCPLSSLSLFTSCRESTLSREEVRMGCEGLFKDGELLFPFFCLLSFDAVGLLVTVGTLGLHRTPLPVDLPL